MQKQKLNLMSNVELETLRMPKLIAKPKLERIKFELCLILLIGTIFLSGCKSHEVPRFPIKYMYEVDFDFQACGQYEINPKTRLKKHVQDLPIEMCNGVMGFQAEDVPKLENWIDDLVSYLKKKFL